MARQNINLGTNANDGTGDKLRDAMQKVNENLIELYDRTGGDGTLTSLTIGINGNTIGITSDMTITTNNAGNLTISAPSYFTKDVQIPESRLAVNSSFNEANVSLLVNGNAKINANTTLGNDVYQDLVILNSRIQGTIEPNTDITHDLGSVSLRYRNAFIGGAITTNSILTANANISGGKINNTIIGDASPTFGRFTDLTTVGDSNLGDLLVRDNQISTGIVNGDIEFRPNGAGNVYVSTKLIVGAGSTPMVNPVLQATGNADNFSQIGVQNTNNGKFACSDIVVFTNDGSDFFNFADIGQNNTGWDGSLQYLYFDQTSAAITWDVGDTVVQYDLSDGSSILARGQIDEIVNNPLNPNELRMRVCNVFEGTTGIFDQGSVHGDVWNEVSLTSATPKEHLVETFTATGVATYNIGSGTLNSSTARAAFAPTVVLASDSVEVKVNGVTQHAGVDFVIQFNKIKFRTIPSAGSTITIRQYPDANYPFTVGQSGDSYVYNNGSKFTIGTMTGHDILFHTNGVRYTSEAGRIKGDTKNWIIGSGVTDQFGFTDTGEKLQVHGNSKVIGNSVITGNSQVDGNTVNAGNLTVNGNLIISSRTITSSTGSPNDVVGMIAVDANYLYNCFANYDGSSQIWNRTPLASLPW